jgi:hypothetical protein
MTQYRDEVTAAHVGRRVVVRHRIADEVGGRVPTDAVGELVAADDATFTVRRRDGDTVVVAREHVLASKLLPPARARRRRRQDRGGPEGSPPRPPEP